MMNKKFCVVIIALIMLCMATVVVFAQQYTPTQCPAHYQRWRDGCMQCRIAQNNIERNREAQREREREQRQREAEARRQREEAEAQRQREAEAQRQAENQQPSGGFIFIWTD